ncbi:MAG: flagellar assembly protein FliX [Pseudomonadota bacterium]|uniref:flagellar assembly regulator FliX n=1 Tax=unclassified Phenylobacterium TaxID=2640670 RepID=UPI000715456A|nr:MULTISPECIES: flagellar assembly protein FliX [unclassified Phenylobacterium]KRB40073.1 flagellar assembly protein FliX [Phenylobacterium sp. Root700]MBT9469729.1 flagellar assembly protein FliX [Phenylobacterium sp.]
MKVSGTSSVGSTGGAGKPRAAGGEGFQIAQPPAAAGPAQVARAGGVGGVMSVDAILALQEVAGPLERRRRAVGRAGKILDVLEDVKIGLLSGELSADDLDRLRRAVRDERLGTDDEHLEGVLNEIETRAAVELAKLECANRAA